MSDQEIARCPNPECGMNCLVSQAPRNYPSELPFQVACLGCGYRAPRGETETAAMAAHNALCRGMGAVEIGPDLRRYMDKWVREQPFDKIPVQWTNLVRTLGRAEGEVTLRRRPVEEITAEHSMEIALLKERLAALEAKP